MIASEATADKEVPVFLPAGEELLFGVLTRPVAEPRSVAAVILPGGGFHTAVHVNRLSVRLARRLAGDGYHVLRIDYHGLGESSGTLRGYRLDEPFLEDVEASVSWLRKHEGIRRFVIVGGCFGGRTALAAAPRIVGLEAIVVLTAPLVDLGMGEGSAARRAAQGSMLRYWARGLRPVVLRSFLSPRSFRRQARVARTHVRVGVRAARQRITDRRALDGRVVSPGVVRELEALDRHGIPALFVYGDRDPFREPFAGGSEHVSRLLKEARGRIEVATVEGTRAYRLVAGQEEILDMVPRWLGRAREGRLKAG